MRNGSIEGILFAVMSVCMIVAIVGFASKADRHSSESQKNAAIAQELRDRIDQLEAAKKQPAEATPFAVVDYEDMAGLDAETQAMLAENERSGNDIDRRLRAIEANIDALNHRVFGPRVRPGAIGEMGAEFDAGPSVLGSDGADVQ